MTIYTSKYKKFRLSRKKKESTLHQDILRKIKIAAKAITKFGIADNIHKFLPYFPMIETFQIDHKDLDLSKYRQTGTYDMLILEDINILGDINI